MKTSQQGIDLIKSFESLQLKAYVCPAGVLTIGWGSTKGVYVGMVITPAQAEKYLREDLSEFEEAIARHVKAELNQNQFDALVCWSYNCGIGALVKSTLLKKLNAKDYAGAAAEFKRWNKAQGRVLKGLTRRREAEEKLFLMPIKGADTQKIITART